MVFEFRCIRVLTGIKGIINIITLTVEGMVLEIFDDNVISKLDDRGGGSLK